jgi:glycosyltransferase involved in cell wall biosynthesis
MRIAQVVNTLPPYWSGTGIAALKLSEALAKRGHHVELFTPLTKENRLFEYNGVEVKRLTALLRFGQAPFTPGLIRLKHFDIIHLHFPYYFGAELVYWSSFFRHIPIVVTYHNDVIKPGMIGHFVDWHSRVIAPWLLDRASRVFAMSLSFLGESLVLSRMKKKGDIRIIPQGVDTCLFYPGQADMSSHLGIPKGHPVLIFVRSLDKAHYHSGLMDLLLAMRYSEPDSHLLVVGDGELLDRYEKSARELMISDRVHFIGAISNHELPRIYASADIFILPSAETENAGLVLLEAMASGLPVVATRIGGTAEIVRDYTDGILVSPRDSQELASAINILINDKALAKQMGQAGAQRVKESMSWDYIASLVDANYQEILCGSHSLGTSRIN